MSATSAPYGFVPVRHPTGQVRSNPYPIAAAYATQINKGMPVILNTNGTITAGTAAADLLGVFHGVEYTDTTGRRVVSNYWPSGGVTGATNIVAYVNDDPATIYSVQADGSIAATAVGDQADVSNVGNQGSGFSQATLSATLAGAGVQAQFRILDVDRSVDNAWGDSYTKVLVQIARHQFVGNKVAI